MRADLLVVDEISIAGYQSSASTGLVLRSRRVLWRSLAPGPSSRISGQVGIRMNGQARHFAPQDKARPLIAARLVSDAHSLDFAPSSSFTSASFLPWTLYRGKSGNIHRVPMDSMRLKTRRRLSDLSTPLRCFTTRPQLVPTRHMKTTLRSCTRSRRLRRAPPPPFTTCPPNSSQRYFGCISNRTLGGPLSPTP